MAAAAAEAEIAEVEQLLQPAGGVTVLTLARPSRLESEGSRAKRWLSSGEDSGAVRRWLPRDGEVTRLEKTLPSAGSPAPAPAAASAGWLGPGGKSCGPAPVGRKHVSPGPRGLVRVRARAQARARSRVRVAYP